MTDFVISSWGRYLIINAQTERGVAWLHDHWRTKGEPPATRATKVDRLLSEIVYWWDNWEPTYSYSFGDETAKARLQAAERMSP